MTRKFFLLVIGLAAGANVWQESVLDSIVFKNLTKFGLAVHYHIKNSSTTETIKFTDYREGNSYISFSGNDSLQFWGTGTHSIYRMINILPFSMILVSKYKSTTRLMLHLFITIRDSCGIYFSSWLTILHFALEEGKCMLNKLVNYCCCIIFSTKELIVDVSGENKSLWFYWDSPVSYL